MFINKYKKIKKLGRSPSGQTFLVQDQKGTSFALQVRPLKQIFREVLLDEIANIKKIDSPYIVKLLETETDETNIYFVFEYCNCGDLLQNQIDLPQKVFTLKRATEIMAEVIVALQYIHKQGYTYNSIKPKKILFSNQNGKEQIKVKLDLPFAEQQQIIKDSFGEEFRFKPPELYSSQQTGFYVDMWALGVLLYFMLNKQYPFKISPYWETEKQGAECKKMAKEFSYSRSVQASHGKLVANCTIEVQDLFKKMFEADPQKRMRFDEIRQHPVFRKYFPQVQQSTRQLYGRLQNGATKDLKYNISEKILPNSLQNQQSLQHTLERKKAEIDFLKQIAEEFMSCEFLNLPENLMLVYNLTKYYLILLRDFKQSLNVNLSYALLRRKNTIAYLHPVQFNQSSHSISKVLQTMLKDVEDGLSEGEFEFVTLYRKCQTVLQIIESMNPHFREEFSCQIGHKAFQGNFRRSYRISTTNAFRKLKQLAITIEDKSERQLIRYMLVLAIISHAFNFIFSDQKDTAIIFHHYLEQTGRGVGEIDYRELKTWIKACQKEILSNIGKSILRLYFQ